MKTYLVVGRMQPMHIGHLSIIHYITDKLDFNFKKDRIIIVNGSANESRTKKNPFTWQERKKMISKTLDEEYDGKLNYEIKHIDDYENYMDWVKKLIEFADVKDVNDVTVVGRDDVDVYSRLTGFKAIIVPEGTHIHATQIREQLNEGKIPTLCPEQVRKWLKNNDGIKIVQKSYSHFNY